MLSMANDVSPNRVPTLAQYCYRFINSHLDSVESLGGIPYPLIEPVLRSCSAEQLLTLEKNSPHLKNEDQDVWRSLCFRDFRWSEQHYEKGEISEPVSWRKQYFVCRTSEEKRLEEVGLRIKNKRQEVEEEKKERQVVYTDRVPPAKRSRFNAGPNRPKTLFEKTRAESIKIQRSVYGSAILPPMPTVKTIKSRAIAPKFSRISSKLAVIPAGANAPRAEKLPTPNNQANFKPNTTLVKMLGAPPTAGGKTLSKKDPMATLFMPKHKAHSQLPNESLSSFQRAK